MTSRYLTMSHNSYQSRWYEDTDLDPIRFTLSGPIIQAERA
jgi:hypothetical protein